MAESPDGEEDGKLRPGSASENDGAAKKRVVRQPNRRQHERDVQALTEQISAKEAELKSLGRPTIESSPAEAEEREGLLREQKRIREEREATIAKRKEYDENLHKISAVISRQSDALSRLKANLPHKTEQAVDDAIRKLELQLQTQHFKLRDEKRIVNEITKLKRSKKQVQLYQTKRMEMEADIRKKEETKKERSIYFKRVSELKSKEDEIRQKLLSLKSKADQAWSRYREAGPQRDRLKKDIDHLYEMRRQLNADFQAQQKDFREFSELQRIENERRKEDERKAQEANHRKEWFLYEQSREPFEEERTQVSSLITYLHKLLPKGEGLAASQGGSPQSGVSPSTSVSSVSVSRSSSFKGEEGTFTILRKKGDEDDEVFLQAASRKKKGRRKSWMNKPIRHSREIFNQFASIDLSAPSTPLEVSEVLEKLQIKLQYYEDAAASVKMAHSAIPQNPSASSSVSSGIVTATDVEDTYDIQEEDDEQVSLGVESNHGNGARDSADTAVGDDETLHIPESSPVQTISIEGAQGNGEIANDAAVIRQSNNERSSSDSSSVNSPNAAADTQSCIEKQNARLNFEGTVRSDSAADEAGSSGSEESHESKEGNVTDDSESTVVAVDGESGQSSPSDGSSARKATRDEESAAHVLEGQVTVGVKNTEGLGELSEALLELTIEVEVDKEREDSGMGDVHEDTSKKAGIVERKNESLKLIVSKRDGKDPDPSKADLLSSSQTEYSSDYASNSTGSAVSTPTDVLPHMKREPLLIDTNPLMGKEMNDPENVFHGDHDSDWSSMSNPGQLDESDDADHAALISLEDPGVGLESAQLTSREPQVSTEDIFLQNAQL